MKCHAMPLAIFACLLLPRFLFAQADAVQELPLPPVSPWLLQPAVSDAAVTAAKPYKRYPHCCLFQRRLERPLTPRDVQMREAVQALGVDKHRFVRCHLKDGSYVVGGITGTSQSEFGITRGILHGRRIHYWELAEPPQRVAAVGEHTLNGLKWAGFVTGCIAVSPLVIPFTPLVLAGVIQD